MSQIDIKTLRSEDASQLAPLIAENAQALKRGAPRRPDEFYAENILGDKNAEVIGAFKEGKLVGFAVFFDMPELITGLRIGQLDNIYVHPDFRKQGIGRQMIGNMKSTGKSRGWMHIRWMVPESHLMTIGLYETIAEPDRNKSFIIPIERSGN
ncbi:MAG: GNAT family N-acetyltransferase [Rhodobacteraceae bacterium]|nr:GNAT family N-acetyltransferase [Paracoccaceae bacterium]